MDERLKYEQLIAGKLESLPLPDLQDQIWARIKAQLDIDLPTDDGDGGTGPQQPSGPGIMGWGLSVVLVAFITAFIFLQNKPQTTNTIAPFPLNNQATPPVKRVERPPDPRTGAENRTIRATPEPTTALPDNRQDSAFTAPANPVVAAAGIPDSATTGLPEPPLTLTQPKVDSTPPAKKSRGVKGLTNDDYRVVPKNE